MNYFYIKKKVLDGLQKTIMQMLNPNVQYTVDEIFQISEQNNLSLTRGHVLRICQELQAKNILVQNGKKSSAFIYKINKESICK